MSPYVRYVGDRVVVGIDDVLACAWSVASVDAVVAVVDVVDGDAVASAEIALPFRHKHTYESSVELALSTVHTKCTDVPFARFYRWLFILRRWINFDDEYNMEKKQHTRIHIDWSQNGTTAHI